MAVKRSEVDDSGSPAATTAGRATDNSLYASVFDTSALKIAVEMEPMMLHKADTTSRIRETTC